MINGQMKCRFDSSGRADDIFINADLPLEKRQLWPAQKRMSLEEFRAQV
jgi:hypothetical protein